MDRKVLDRAAASTSQMGRFETEWLTAAGNLSALSDLSGAWIDRFHEPERPKSIALHMDSSESPTHGKKEGSTYNDHFDCTCYHPLFCFNQFGDVERSLLRSGNVHSADGWRTVLEPVVGRYRNHDLRRYFRTDAAFANSEVYDFLEAEGFKYAIHLPANAVLQQSITYLLKRPVGRPTLGARRYYASFSYRVGGCDRSRRVVAKVEWRPGDSIPRRIHRDQHGPTGGTGGDVLQPARHGRAVD